MDELSKILDRYFDFENWWRWVVSGILMMFAGAAIMFGPSILSPAKAMDVQRREDGIRFQVQELTENLPEAHQVLDAHKPPKFPSYYTADYSRQLSNADELLAPKGRISDLLLALDEDQESKNWDGAYADLKSLNEALQPTVVVNELAEGNARAYLLELDRKAMDIDSGYLVKVGDSITSTRQYIDELPRKVLCDEPNRKVQTFSASYFTLQNGQVQLAVAFRAFQTPVEGIIDKPAVYDEGKKAEELIATARIRADVDSANVVTAYTQIISADKEITDTITYVAASSYNKVNAKNKLAEAKGEVAKARQACYGEDFIASMAYADSAIKKAEDATDLAATPTPTPLPTNTPEPTSTPEPSSSSSTSLFDSSDDDSDSGGSWDSGGTDSGSWGSDSDGGWDSGSDSGSWDTGGGSDSGSWDTGGSDSGSW